MTILEFLNTLEDRLGTLDVLKLSNEILELPVEISSFTVIDSIYIAKGFALYIEGSLEE